MISERIQIFRCSKSRSMNARSSANSSPAGWPFLVGNALRSSVTLMEGMVTLWDLTSNQSTFVLGVKIQRVDFTREDFGDFGQATVVHQISFIDQMSDAKLLITSEQTLCQFVYRVVEVKSIGVNKIR
jgi:hypothetical protein